MAGLLYSKSVAYNPLLLDKLVFCVIYQEKKISVLCQECFPWHIIETSKMSELLLVGFGYRHKTASIFLSSFHVHDCSLLLGWVTKFLQLI